MRFTPYTLIAILFLFVAGCRKDNDDQEPSQSPVIPASFLSSSQYDQLIVEIQYVQGFQPTASALNNMKTFLDQRLNKPAGISITQTEIPSPGKSVYTFTDIQNIEKANRTVQANGKILTAYILFIDGDYSENQGNSKTLGFAYGSSSMTVFEKTVKEFSGSIGKPSTANMETTVLNHEFGHTLGLVNRGTPMQSQHLDQAHDKHCSNQKCLMYYSAETSGIMGSIMGAVPALDSACIADLRGNGGK